MQIHPIAVLRPPSDRPMPTQIYLYYLIARFATAHCARYPCPQPTIRMSSITHSCSMEPEFYTIPTSRFFQEERADALPSPSEIRALNRQSGDIRAEEFYRPTPARLPSLGLIVKYGAGVTIHEAKTQIMLREKLSGQVPIPEVFGWTTEGGQVFIYMQLMDGETLQARWHLLDEEERISLCAQLKSMVDCWRRLPQDGYIGSLAPTQILKAIWLTTRQAVQADNR